jgi:hypothetical protein
MPSTRPMVRKLAEMTRPVSATAPAIMASARPLATRTPPKTSGSRAIASRRSSSRLGFLRSIASTNLVAKAGRLGIDDFDTGEADTCPGCGGRHALLTGKQYGLASPASRSRAAAWRMRTSSPSGNTMVEFRAAARAVKGSTILCNSSAPAGSALRLRSLEQCCEAARKHQFCALQQPAWSTDVGAGLTNSPENCPNGITFRSRSPPTLGTEGRHFIAGTPRP